MPPPCFNGADVRGVLVVPHAARLRASGKIAAKSTARGVAWPRRTVCLGLIGIGKPRPRTLAAGCGSESPREHNEILIISHARSGKERRERLMLRHRGIDPIMRR